MFVPCSWIFEDNNLLLSVVVSMVKDYHVRRFSRLVTVSNLRSKCFDLALSMHGFLFTAGRSLSVL